MREKSFPGIDRRKFEAELPNDMWQSDVMHGPSVAVPGRGRRKCYLIAFLDDDEAASPGWLAALLKARFGANLIDVQVGSFFGFLTAELYTKRILWLYHTQLFYIFYWYWIVSVWNLFLLLCSVFYSALSSY